MTVSSTNHPQNRYAGNGSATVFNYDFPVTAEADLEVIVAASDGAETVQTLTSDYAVTGAGAADGGTVVMVSAPVSGETLVIRRNVGLTQETDYVENDPFPAETHEAALDKLTLICQQLDEVSGRALKFKKSSAHRNVDVPDPSASRFLRWNEAGTGLENVNVSDLSLYTVSPFAQTLLDDADAADALSTLGFSAFVRSLVDGENAGDFLTALDVSAFARTLLDDVDGATAMSTLGVSSFARTLVDDGDATTARGTLGLGTAATKDTGTSQGNVVELGAGGALPAVDAGNLVGFAVARGHIAGLALSRASSSTLGIAAGQAADDGASVYMNLSSAFTKAVDTAWAEGTGNGSLDTGSLASGTWYHVWLIHNPTSGAVDILTSASVSSPAMPSGFSRKRRIGSFFTDGSSGVTDFVQDGDWFWWKAPPLDVDSSSRSFTTTGATATLHTLSVPAGVSVLALLDLTIMDVSGSHMAYLYLSSPDVDDVAPSGTSSPLATAKETASGTIGGHQALVRTDTGGRVRSRTDNNNAYLDVATLGWMDNRGRDE